jgi:hypothetical protein
MPEQAEIRGMDITAQGGGSRRLRTHIAATLF